MYLYDLVDIKKEASNPLKTTKQTSGTKPLLFKKTSMWNYFCQVNIQKLIENSKFLFYS